MSNKTDFSLLVLFDDIFTDHGTLDDFKDLILVAESQNMREISTSLLLLEDS